MKRKFKKKRMKRKKVVQRTWAMYKCLKSASTAKNRTNERACMGWDNRDNLNGTLYFDKEERSITIEVNVKGIIELWTRLDVSVETSAVAFQSAWQIFSIVDEVLPLKYFFSILPFLWQCTRTRRCECCHFIAMLWNKLFHTTHFVSCVLRMKKENKCHKYK